MSAIGYFMYRIFNIEKFNILVIECVSVIIMEFRASIGYFHFRAELSYWLL